LGPVPRRYQPDSTLNKYLHLPSVSINYRFSVWETSNDKFDMASHLSVRIAIYQILKGDMPSAFLALSFAVFAIYLLETDQYPMPVATI
jgi:hypothetical protein